MSELPPDKPDWQRREEAVARAREAIGKGMVVGCISVLYDSPVADTGQVWIKADCSSCGANRVMRASDAIHMRLLAFDLVRYGCPENGHDQSGQIEPIGGVLMALGDMSLEQLTMVEGECRDRFTDARDDLMVVQDVRERRFPVRPES